MSVSRIPLTKGRFAIVDAADAEWLGQWRWCFSGRRKTADGGYASRGTWDGQRCSIIYMHRLIAAPSGGEHVDHINGDKLDNRRANLRLCSPSENLCNKGPQCNNRSGFKGVSLHAASGRWSAQITRHGIHHYLGLFETPEVAAEEYNAAAIRLHGQFAFTNHTKGARSDGHTV